MATPETSTTPVCGASKPLSLLSSVMLVAWVGIVGSYLVMSLVAHRGPLLTAYGDFTQLAAAGFACAGLFMNSTTSQKRSRVFWVLLGAGCGIWLIGQAVWTYFEVILRQDVPNPFIGDVILFLHPVSMIGALALNPHDQRDDLNVHIGYVDFSLLLVWWIYLYLFIVIPWQFIAPDVHSYGVTYDYLSGIENAVLVSGFAVLIAKTKGPWRQVYTHLFGAALTYAASSVLINVAIDYNNYYTGSPYDLPLVASFVWFGTAGIVAHRLKLQRESIPSNEETRRWMSIVAMIAVFSIPVMALWSLWSGSIPREVSSFRVAVTQVTLVVAAVLIAVRQRLVDRDRLRLLAESRKSIEHLRIFQAQMVQSEKLVSLGQLAAGAAHEINNPLTGVLGYSDLLIDDGSMNERQRAIAEKIRILARRIKTLVSSLLSFARQVPSEKTELDLSHVVSSALHLSNLDLRGAQISVENLVDESLSPIVGDANQILQVFFNLISNAVDALEEVGGGKLVIRGRESEGKVLLEFSDSGPGIKSPGQVFDPFFTTKPVGKGTGLGLSICYGIVQEHRGHIECYNRPGGGATFLVGFPTASNAGYVYETDLAAHEQRS
ncbi:MAG: HAMP domain-containing sensor histidine kinase [Candidatus Acidiferrales bacterium]